MTDTSRKYEVVNARTGERFGNHTHAEAITRAHVMARNWLYREKFEVCEKSPTQLEH